VQVLFGFEGKQIKEKCIKGVANKLSADVIFQDATITYNGTDTVDVIIDQKHWTEGDRKWCNDYPMKANITLNTDSVAVVGEDYKIKSINSITLYTNDTTKSNKNCAFCYDIVYDDNATVHVSPKVIDISQFGALSFEYAGTNSFTIENEKSNYTSVGISGGDASRVQFRITTSSKDVGTYTVSATDNTENTIQLVDTSDDKAVAKNYTLTGQTTVTINKKEITKLNTTYLTGSVTATTDGSKTTYNYTQGYQFDVSNIDNEKIHMNMQFTVEDPESIFSDTETSFIVRYFSKTYYDALRKANQDDWRNNYPQISPTGSYKERYGDTSGIVAGYYTDNSE